MYNQQNTCGNKIPMNIYINKLCDQPMNSCAPKMYTNQPMNSCAPKTYTNQPMNIYVNKMYDAQARPFVPTISTNKSSDRCLMCNNVLSYTIANPLSKAASVITHLLQKNNNQYYCKSCNHKRMIKAEEYKIDTKCDTKCEMRSACNKRTTCRQ